MRTASRSVAPALLVGALFAGGALAHGGGHAPPLPPPYTGPGDTVPQPGHPGTPGPGGPTTPRPGGPAGPTTPAPTGGPTTPSPGAGPVTPGGGAMPIPKAPGGPMTGGMAGPSFESWRYWWAFNRDRYLRLKAHVNAAEAPFTASDATEASTSMRPTKLQIARDVVPVLREALAGETHRDFVSACVISLAKIADDPAKTARAIEGYLSHASQPIAETAAVALGILGSAEAMDALTALYKDDKEGRRLCGNVREVHWRTRSYAAFGLGLLGAHTKNPHHRKGIQEQLLTFLDSEGASRSPHKDLRVATVIALGMIPDPEQRGVMGLRRMFAAQKDRESFICAHVAPAVARLMSGASLPDRTAYVEELLKALDDRTGRNDRFLRASYPLALGLLTRHDDPHAPRVVKALIDCTEKDRARNPEASYFGLIALGQIAGTGDPGSEAEKSLLARATASGGRVATRGWAALALGVAGFAQSERTSKPAKDDIGEALVDAMRATRDPEQLAAFAIALGLRGTTSGAPELLRQLDEVKVEDFRGYFALGLGLMGAREARDPILKHVKSSVRKPAFFQQAAIGLALLGDKRVVGTLSEILRDPGSQSFAVQSAVADALGYVGDYRAVDPLVSAVKDKTGTLTSSSRAFAAVALGVIGDKSELPWNATISANFNYLAAVESLMDLIWEIG